MLELNQIVKKYESGDTEVLALNGVSLKFRRNEFVSILGPSGCGKTTLLNIVGGLDRYTSGDLIINGVSTKKFKDRDWDTYRNHSIGFVFQSYNLIPHQSVLSNVELALTLSGVSKSERRARAIQALKEVGLGDQLHKRPNQMSGGQMQRVAIARALVNNPDILLADEPTGALDTATTVQIMELLKEVAKDRLVIMVTHNPELAEEYSTRIVRLRDGMVVDDSAPYEGEPVAANSPAPKKNKRSKKTSMSFLTALSLSKNNLLTKKGRTILTSFAGSIGIIGIALILSLSNGVNLFIAGVQEDALTSYPISITAQTSDYTAMMGAMMAHNESDSAERDPNKIYVDDSISDMVSAMVSMEQNNLNAFNKYFDGRRDEFKDDILAVQYSYAMDLQIFNANTPYGNKGLMQVSPSSVLSDFSTEYSGLSAITDSISVFSELMPGKDGELINASVLSQYDLIDGRWPEHANELILVVDKNNTVANIALYMLGILDPDDMTAMMAAMMMGESYDAKTHGMEFSYQDFYDLELFVAYNSDFYEGIDESYTLSDGKSFPIWGDKRDKESFEAGSLRQDGIGLKIVGVVSPSDNATATSISTPIAYTSALTEQILSKIDESDIVKQQLANPSFDVFTGLPFAIEDADKLTDDEKIEKLEGYFSSLDAKGKKDAYLAIRTEVTEEEMAGYLAKIKTIINTPEKQKQFLIDLYGFNSKNGSLALGTSANEAIAAILLATDMQPGATLDEYKVMVPSIGSMFELDGIALVDDETSPSYGIYQTYKGLIENMYNTDEKLENAFNSMTEMTFRMVYSMVEEQKNLTEELFEPTAPHMAQFMADVISGKQTAAEMQMYLIRHLMTANGITSPMDSLAQSLSAYVYGMDPMTLAGKYYATRIQNDEEFKNEAIAALFDSYREDMQKTEESRKEYASLYQNHMVKSESTYDDNLVVLGSSEGEKALSAINIYPVDFEAKENIQKLIEDYNAQATEEDQISYTDIMAILLSSVTVIIDAITYVLVAFVSVSLVVSSIMIGIITYISVLERTKEIGILRAIGASKRDISRVFNAETLIVGFAAGAIGVIVTVLLCLPINAIIHALTGMTNINAALPWVAALILVAISMFLTFIAGLIPAKVASKKDPVEALRSE